MAKQVVDSESLHVIAVPADATAFDSAAEFPGRNSNTLEKFYHAMPYGRMIMAGVEGQEGLSAN